MEDATRLYEELLESAPHAESALLGLAALHLPNDAELREKALAATANDKALPELAMALRVGRTVLPLWEDALSTMVENLVDELRRDPPASRTLRVRVQLDEPLPASARVLLRAAALELGIEAELVRDGEGSPPPRAEYVAPCDETVSQVLALKQKALDLDRWGEPGSRLPLEQAQLAYAAPIQGVPCNFVELERQRLAVLALALRGCESPSDEAFVWALALTTAEDTWAARAALLALGAVARRSPALAPRVVSAASTALAREDARSLAAATVKLHCPAAQVDAQARGQALSCVIAARVAAQSARLASRSSRQPDLDSAGIDATIRR
jgi:hypothetical protein